jgi:RNA polymerase sigma factor (sigma-70 family)
MATAQLGAVLRHIRGLAADPTRSERSDGALLRSFLERNDQAAFAVLVQRLGPRVLQICWHALGNADDAEDALQATFLLLARKASSVRKKESLASWLHGVAYRMAANARKAAVRRHKHESRANPSSPRDPGLSAAWRELQVLLDEEIARLPEALRGPFLLCCQQSKSYAEAASQLGLQEGTVRNRLGRARKRLQERLTRRGVALTTALTAVAVGASRASAVMSRSLVGAVAKAATQVSAGQPLVAGTVSDKVLTLVEGVNRAMFLNKCKMAILLLVCTLIVGASLGMAVVRGAAGAEPAADTRATLPAAARAGAKKARSQPAHAPVQAEAKASVRVRGRVLGPDAKPVAGVKLYLGHASAKKVTYPVQATSGDDGRFAFSFPRAALDTTREDHPAFQVLAIAEGYGCGWATISSAAREEVTLRLVKDAPVKGRILDADGQPVRGAKLSVTGVTAAKGHGGQAGARGWEGPLPGQLAVLTTAADGKFRLAGVGPGRVVHLRLEGRGIATAQFDAQGAAFEYQTALSRPIRGVVRDKATRQPLAGVSVTCGLDKSVTNKEGRYALLGVAKAARYGLGLNPAVGQLYFHRVVWVQDRAGLEALTADGKLVRATVAVRGKVTDKATGRPVARARVLYYPLYGNDSAGKMDDQSYPRAETTTGADGTYTLPVMPGPGAMLVAGPRPDAFMPAWVTLKERRAFFKAPFKDGGGEGVFYLALGSGSVGMFGLEGNHAVVLLQPGEKEEMLVRDVVLERGQERKGRVVGPDGQPLTGVTVQGLLPREDVVETLKGAEFTVRARNPKMPARLITFHHKGKNLGSFLKELPAEKDGPLIVKLQPCGSLSGRIVDQDGQPVPRFRGRLSCGHYSRLLGFTTDKDGRFRVERLFSGLGYSVWQDEKLSIVKIHPGAVVEPGKKKDLGDIKSLIIAK